MTNVYLKLYKQAIRNGICAKLGSENWQTLTVLASFMDENGEAYPTQQQLSELLGVSREMVNKRIKRLLSFRLEDGSPLVTCRKTKVQKNYVERCIYQINPESGFAIFTGIDWNKEDDVKSNSQDDVNQDSQADVKSNSQDDVNQDSHKEDPREEDPKEEEPNKEEGENNQQVNQDDQQNEEEAVNHNKVVINNAKDFIKYFCKKYRETYNVNYTPTWKRDASMVKSKLISNFQSDELVKIIDTVFAEYDNRWGNKRFPRPSIGQLVSWLANEALAVAQEKEKTEKEEKERIEKAQNDPHRSKDYINKVAQKLENDLK